MSPEMVQNVMATLLHGQGYAISLKTIFQNREISSAVSVEPLIDTILDSFSLALSFVNAPSLQVPPHHESSSSQRSLKKKICEVEITKHYRDDSPTPLLDDGFVWRKYGQKTIKNTPHQRCYYRCTYAKDQNCKAIKRVQKIQNNPPIYRTTYVGQHKCQAMAFAVFSETDDAPGSKMIQFGKYDHVMSQSVIPQVASVDHPNIIMEDKAINRNTNQECDVNDFLVDDDPLWAYQFPPFSPGDFMFLEDLPAS